MVYCGKPSKGCSNCRERKIRCDQRMPTCGQCEKRNQKCPGYRNMVDLMFRDESNHVIKKANTARKRLNKSREAANGSASGGSTALPSPSPRSSSSSSESPTATTLVHHSRPFIGTPKSSSSVDGLSPDREPLGETRLPNDTRQIRRHHADVGSGTVTAAASEIPYALTPSLQERGVAFFFARYVATDHGCYQNYDFIYDVWRPPPNVDMADMNDGILASMTAVGLTGLSKLTRCPEAMTKARQSYVLALHLANEALRDPVVAVKDSTMLAVLILGTYEFVSGRTPQTIRAWQDHVNGAAALATMRGAGQFRTRAGTRMFIMLCHTVLISCVRSGLPMPQSMVDLRNQLWHLTDTRGPIWRVVDTLYNALQVRHDITSGKVVGVDAIVEKLSGVEDQFAALVDSLPNGFKYREAKLMKPHPAVMGDSCHIYLGLTQATTWNGMRTMRMLVQETILDVLYHSVDDPTNLPAHHQMQMAKAMKLIRMLGDAFVASVPQHFGVVSSKDVKRDDRGRRTVTPVPTSKLPCRIISSSAPKSLPDTPSNKQVSVPTRSPTLLDPTQSTGHEKGHERFLTLATASHTIIWPLYTLGMSSSCTPETMAYVLDRLDAIYKETGFEQARTVSNIIREKVHALSWDDFPTATLPTLPEGSLPIMV
ncbi:C6 finger domain-containing protein [Purpureocillium lilacinum]|uniref:C6 finger domain-containing protein n=1 Tax=Purpureocillium lilacinum TaxID=33203 RepID=A0A179HIU1_PURLI|nr:C6 finger domain-containing protein [Purpureocillium lilacinum]OAQ89822.1 C6 finger domain-containing protein [Purpureocillium lilacinum]